MTEGYLSEIFTSFQGEGTQVGKRHVFVRLAACNLRCRYCDTPDSLVRTETCTIYDTGGTRILQNPIPADAANRVVRDMIAADGFVDAVAITGGEPLLQPAFLREWLSAAPLGVPTMLETNGVLPAALSEVIDLIDIVSMDIKPPSSSGERAFWAEHEKFLTIAVRKDVYVKIVVDAATTADEIEIAARLVSQVSNKIEMFLQPMMSPEGGSMLGGQHLEHLYRAARNHASCLRILPQTHKLIGIQ